jgi:hypothetical protein
MPAPAHLASGTLLTLAAGLMHDLAIFVPLLLVSRYLDFWLIAPTLAVLSRARLSDLSLGD